MSDSLGVLCGSPFKSFRHFVSFNRIAPFKRFERLELLERLKLLLSAPSSVGEFKGIVRIRLEMHSLDPG